MADFSPVEIEIVDDEAEGKACPLCEERVFINAKRAQAILNGEPVDHAVMVTAEREDGSLVQRNVSRGLCSACAEIVADSLGGR